MIRKLLLGGLIAATLATSGCANMTPEQQDAAVAGAVLGGLAVAAAALATRPSYSPPPRYYRPAPRVSCGRYRCFSR